jgi:hypothetical protein
MIDVEKLCVVPAPSKAFQFAALSYCWGTEKNSKHLRLTSHTLPILTTEDALAHGVPDTIADAIVLVRTLHMRYLWVDALCILQDNVEEMQTQIKCMGYLFKCSFLTIAAAAGDDAWAGLPGVQQPRSTPHYENITGIGLGTTLPSHFKSLALSTWQTPL